MVSAKKNPNRDKAYRMWEKSGRTLSPKAIGEKLNESPRQISKWKCLDKWEEKTVPKGGGQPGNKNAVGNKGGKGAPERNTYAEKHGAYSKIYFDTLDDEERELLAAVEPDEEQILLVQLQDLVIKARRLKRRIKAVEGERGGLSLDGVVRERTPTGEKTVTYTTNTFDRLIKLEGELDKTQGRITKIAEALMRCRNEKARLSLEQQRLQLLANRVQGYIEVDLDDEHEDGAILDDDLIDL